MSRGDPVLKGCHSALCSTHRGRGAFICRVCGHDACPWMVHVGVLTCAGGRGGVLQGPVEAAVAAAHAGSPALRVAVQGALGTELVPRG